MKSLYRRYRPQKLDEVVGEEQVTQPLSSALKEGRVSHAYLFVGPRGCGKTSVARILAHEVNGFSYELEDDYVDIIEIDGASNRGIDNIRELREKVAIAPTLGKYKVYIIDEVHMLTKEAFNALLKTLEEPPEHVIFIMATTDVYKVPVTITSRAQTYTFKLANPEVMFAHLKKICEKEKIKIADDALKIVVKRGGGSFRDSLSLLDQISTLSSDEITKELVVSAMGLPEDEAVSELLESYISGDVTKITALLKDLLNSGIKSETLAEEMIALIVENPRTELMPLLGKLPEVKDPFAEAKLLVCLFNNVKEKIIKTDEKNHKVEIKNHKVEVEKHKIEFNWEKFLETVKGMNDAIYSQVAKAGHETNGGVLHIYPDKKIARTILARDNNKRILIDAAGGMRVEVHEVGENPAAKKDALISKISDIMGGEVSNDGGGSPF